LQKNYFKKRKGLLKKYLIIGLCFTFILVSIAQKHCFKAYIYDAESKEALQYVNIWVPSLKTGTVSDENGKFILFSNQVIDSLRISYIGYQTLCISTQLGTNNQRFYLKKQSSVLPEIRIVAGESSANRIVRLVQQHIKENNPYYYPSYTVKQYAKTFFSSEIVNDSLAEIIFLDTINALFGNKELYSMLKRQHFFLSESVMERNYKFQGKKNDRLLASKISGFNDPFFQILFTQMQSFSFYDEKYMLFYNTFKNPLSDKNFSFYFFYLEDTAVIGNDTLFTISFKPLKNKKFEAITGYMVIHSGDWAVEHVVAAPVINTSILSFITEQHYEKIDGKYWFPVLTSSKLNIKTFGSSLPVTSYTSIKNKEIHIGIPLKNRQFINDEIYIDSPETYKQKSDSILAIYRDAPISPKDEHTYIFWDTVKKDINIDESIFALKTLASGEIPIKWIDFKLDRILKFTGQETARLGIGLETNDHLSKYFLIGGYFGYGFKDNKCKWGLNSGVLLEGKRKLRLSVSAYHDIFKAGSNVEARLNDTYRFSMAKANNIILVINGLLNNYDYVRHADIDFSGIINRWLEGKLIFSYTQHQAAYIYTFTSLKTEITSNFSYSLAEISLLFHIKSTSTLYTFGDLNMHQKTFRPEVSMLYSRGIKGVFGSDFTYNRLDFNIEQTINFRLLGDFHYLIKAGFVDNDLPYSALYSVHGAWLACDVFDANSFATMRIDEFLSDKYVSFQVSQKFPALYKTELSIPIPQLLFHIAWGDLRHPEYHLGNPVNFKQMNHGYFEAGIAVHDILHTDLTGIGIAVFYRFGYYRLPTVIENFSFRITVSIFGK